MKCIHHLDRDACAQCAACGKFLCSECATIWNPPLCQDCGAAAEKAEKNKTKSMIVWAVLLGIIGMLFGLSVCTQSNSMNFFAGLIGTLTIGYALAGIPFGWNALSSFKLGNLFLIPIVGLIMLGLKFILAYLVGFVAMPVYIVKAIIRRKREKQSS